MQMNTFASRSGWIGQTKRYYKLETIGQGSFAVVYRALDCEKHECVAIKQIYILRQSNGVPSYVIREISILRDLDHKNIVRLLDVLHDADERRVYIVLEHMKTNLKEFLQTFSYIFMSPNSRRNILHQILSGLAYCHSHKILHRDLKPSNVLIKHDIAGITVKLADFGLSTPFGFPRHAHTPEMGTNKYMAPELLLGDAQYSSPIDVWSVGCIFAEMVIWKPLFNGVNRFLVLLKIFSIMGTPNEEIWPEVTSICGDLLTYLPIEQPKNLAEFVPGLEPAGVDLLSKMLCVNPNRRIAAQETLEHPYFKDFHTT